MVYGYYSRSIKNYSLEEDFTCPACEIRGCMQIEVICRINHIMFLPTVPNKKEAVVSCRICNSKYYPDAFPNILDLSQKKLKKTKYPWYYYTGIILISLFVIFIVSLMVRGEIENKNRKEAQVENIKAGQVLFLKSDDEQKTSMYIDSIVGEDIFIRKNNLSTKEDPYTIDEPENYQTETTIYKKEQIRKMNEDGIISDIALTLHIPL